MLQQKNRSTLVALMLVFVLMLSLPLIGTQAEELKPLPMDSTVGGPEPKEECYISDTEYEDASISVKIYEGRYADTDYVFAHVKIVDPSQFRTAPAAIQDVPGVDFKSNITARGRYVARAVNAVIALNGDYHIMDDKCQVLFRQGKQYRNVADGTVDCLIVDKNADFTVLRQVTRNDYANYYSEHKGEMYNVFCFGPEIIENNEILIADNYVNNAIGSLIEAQRSAIAQLGSLEYMLITSLGPQSENNKGMTLPEFAKACQEASLTLSDEGCKVCYNLDGGNSATMIFKRWSNEYGHPLLLYSKVNCPDIERFLSDIVYFATLVE